MTIFELVKFALDELYEEAVAEHGDEADEAIQDCINTLQGSYKNLTKEDREPVDYSDPVTRFAYVYMYTAAHAAYIYRFMTRVYNEIEAPLLGEGKKRVACIGGGPGSDIIGFIRYLDKMVGKENPEKVTFYLLDREQSWADTWTEIDDQFAYKTPIKTNFQPFDVTDSDSWRSQKKFLQSDIFMMSYFVSEVYSLDDGSVTEFWNALFEAAKPGALFLYIDNGADVFNEYFDDIWKDAGMELVYSEDNEPITPTSDEQASVLEEYKEKFGKNTKLKSWVSMRALRKPSDE